MGFKRSAFLTAATLAVGLGMAGCGHVGPLGKKAPVQAAPVIGVNGYLWRATLDTLAFMPLQSADPFGGTVITDWYTNPEKPDERFKATVYILDSRLRADGLKVTIFKQVKDAGGNWVNSSTSDQTETDIENAILTRARQLRLSNIPPKG
jgi:predicted small lipoprotein YifL